MYAMYGNECSQVENNNNTLCVFIIIVVFQGVFTDDGKSKDMKYLNFSYVFDSIFELFHKLLINSFFD